MRGCLLSPSLSLPGKRVAVSIGTVVVVSATVCTDGGETQQKVQTTPTELPDADTDADANPDPDLSLNPNQLHVEFSYDEAVVDACRGFAGAHYDPGALGWPSPDPSPGPNPKLKPDPKREP